MVNLKVTELLWGFILVYESQIISRSSGKDDRTPLEKVAGDNPDI